MIITRGEFENKYRREIILLNIGEGVSFSSALDNLYCEFKRVEGDEKAFNDLLKDWELE